MKSLPRFLQKFIRQNDGALTAFGLFLTVTMICVGGLAIDVANAVKVRTHLQVAADSAAHAALVAREYKTEAEAKAIAVSVAQRALPQANFGMTIEENDILFGTWDAANEVFNVSPGSNDAVLVNTQRLQARANGVGTYFLKFVGVTNIDVVRQSVFETYYPTCFREGFVAEQRVDVQSNNTYTNGFCIHSNDHVEINNGNSFCGGVIVSMPDKADLVIPSSGPGANPCINDALRSGSYRIRILDRINDIIANVDNPNSPYFRTDYVDIDPLSGNVQRVSFDRRDRIEDIWVSGAIHEANCNASNQTITLSGNEILDKGILITNCQVRLSVDSQIKDVLIVTTNTNVDSVQGGTRVTVGENDGCTAGGGAQIVTLGGMNFTQSLFAYGAQFIAAGDFSFESSANGIEGISIVVGGEIDGTSLMDMGFCGGVGMENNFMAEYFRLAT